MVTTYYLMTLLHFVSLCRGRQAIWLVFTHALVEWLVNTWPSIWRDTWAHYCPNCAGSSFFLNTQNITANQDWMLYPNFFFSLVRLTGWGHQNSSLVIQWLPILHNNSRDFPWRTSYGYSDLPLLKCLLQSRHWHRMPLTSEDFIRALLIAQ